jgi:serine/threonine-protein phosphatase 2A regulatory subunit B''
MLDMVRPQEDGKIRLRDLKACALTPIFFDTFINLDKYLEHEQKDPFASIRVSGLSVCCVASIVVGYCLRN